MQSGRKMSIAPTRTRDRVRTKKIIAPALGSLGPFVSPNNGS